jgi:hypothetical protein
MKNKILEYLFRSYARKVKAEAQEVAELKFEAYKSTLDIKDLIRERFKGVRLNRYDDNTILENHLGSLEDENTRLAFLSKAYDIIKNNDAFKIVVESLLVQSEHQAALFSEDMPSVNFNRATCNGAMLVEEELGRLSSMYLSEKDSNKPLTQEEKHGIIN